MRGQTPNLDEQLDRLERASPRFAARWLRWLRKPSLYWLRIPVGILLMLGGVFSFLPILGLWMLPLGLVLIAVDIAFLRGPVARLNAWGEKKWVDWRWKAWTGSNQAAARRSETLRP